MKLTRRGKTVKKVTEWILGIAVIFLSVTNADHVNASTILVIMCVLALLASIQVTLSNIQAESENPIFDEVGRDLRIDMETRLREWQDKNPFGETS